MGKEAILTSTIRPEAVEELPALAPVQPPSREAPPVRTLAEFLFQAGYAFDFFQAVRVLEKLDPGRVPVGLNGPPAHEAVRFHAHLSLSFPPSPIYEIVPASQALPVPTMTVTFLGLTGPSGVLPLHYTELLLRLQRGDKFPEQQALRDWLDLFNHRLISLFYRAWQKYRFLLAYERGEYAALDPDLFTRSLFSFLGLGMPPLRNRLHVSFWEKTSQTEDSQPREHVLAGIDDLALLYYSGLLAHRPRCAAGLEALLCDYFQLTIQVQQFQGQWLLLDAGNQSTLGAQGQHNQLGVSAVVGQRVWDVQGMFRLRVGPLSIARFTEFLPDWATLPQRKAFFLLVHLVRLYTGLELAFDVQLVLRAADMPPCRLTEDKGIGPRLGWNTWAFSHPRSRDADDACFAGEEVFALN